MNDASGVMVAVDVNGDGDGNDDMNILVEDVVSLTADDFLL